MINLIIENPELEEIFRTKFDSNTEKFTEFIIAFIKDNKDILENYSQKQKEPKFEYKKLNPMENYYILESDNLDSEITNPFEDIEKFYWHK